MMVLELNMSPSVRVSSLLKQDFEAFLALKVLIVSHRGN